ncbi:hypothetical protein [Tsuneonella sp. HG222]
MQIIRDDLSDRLVHLTKGPDALLNFINILNTRTLLGGTGFIKGSHRCVCFSEAPVSKLPQILAMPHETVKYRPYGVMFKKQWVFAKGGRPVIYQPDPDYSKLPPEKQHLHVRFWLSDHYNIDHTWEREWRIKTDELKFTPQDVTALVPTRDISDRIKAVFAEKAAEEGKTEPYPWHHIVLEDLGIQMKDYLDGS